MFWIGEPDSYRSVSVKGIEQWRRGVWELYLPRLECSFSALQVGTPAFQLSNTRFQCIAFFLSVHRIALTHCISALELVAVHTMRCTVQSAQCTLCSAQVAVHSVVQCTGCSAQVRANYRANRKHPSWMETAAARTCHCFAIDTNCCILYRILLVLVVLV